MIGTRDGSLLWILLLSAASVAGSWALACATPFAALAALAATRMGRRDGLLLMAVAWFASQAVGFGIHHYSHSSKTLMWGGAIGTAAIVSLLAARWAERRARGGSALQLGAAYLGAVAGYKGMLVLWSLVLGGIGIALSPTYFAQGFVRDGAILLALLLLYRGLVAIGVPAAARGRLAAA
ncbi:hypothetical protein Q4F19_03005 [Sphingomonas sp. BIUV-7]|uniref:Uncharacterized protein n=1 Tax=Sphingomonas natans TaxID=3063330 RepID=A0ABT8Y4U4_9SPHN|nr:hypothetical protein [Sphingomonas sp. BIUV-7]MDO6413341.1 hypothetical protein [Sphingomonas sp. BIUV-7]